MPFQVGDNTPANYKLGDNAVGALYLGDTKLWPMTIPPQAVFPSAAWLWNAIPASPSLSSTNATWVGYLSGVGQAHIVNMLDYGVKVIDQDEITYGTPRYDVSFSNVPAWGTDPFGSDTVPIPAGTVPPSMLGGGGDAHVVVADPLNGKVYGLWQAIKTAGPPESWAASWGGSALLSGDGIDTSGSATATAISRYAGLVRADEMTAAIAGNTDLGHALFCSSDITSSAFAYPAIKSDGDNVGGVATPIPQGTRIQLDPAVNVNSISGITPGEKAIAKTLQKYGAYIGDKGGSRLAFLAELMPDAVDGDHPGAVWVSAGFEWDYFDLTHIPWASLRVLYKWDGSAPPTPTHIETASSGNTANVSSATPTMPSHQAQDLLVLAMSCTAGASSTPPTPSGWTQQIAAAIGGTSSDKLMVWTKIAASSSETVTVSFLSNGGWTANVSSIRGVNQTTPVNVKGSTASGTGYAGSKTAPSVTTTIANCMIMRFAGTSDAYYSTDGSRTFSWGAATQYAHKYSGSSGWGWETFVNSAGGAIKSGTGATGTDTITASGGTFMLTTATLAIAPP